MTSKREKERPAVQAPDPDTFVAQGTPGLAHLDPKSRGVVTRRSGERRRHMCYFQPETYERLEGEVQRTHGAHAYNVMTGLIERLVIQQLDQLDASRREGGRRSRSAR